MSSVVVGAPSTPSYRRGFSSYYRRRHPRKTYKPVGFKKGYRGKRIPFATHTAKRVVHALDRRPATRALRSLRLYGSQTSAERHLARLLKRAEAFKSSADKAALKYAERQAKRSGAPNGGVVNAFGTPMSASSAGGTPSASPVFTANVLSGMVAGGTGRALEPDFGVAEGPPTSRQRTIPLSLSGSPFSPDDPVIPYTPDY